MIGNGALDAVAVADWVVVATTASDRVPFRKDES
jgi:hypothetical protein